MNITPINYQQYNAINTMNMKRNQYSNINFRSVGQSTAESTISKLKAMPFDEFVTEAKIFMNNVRDIYSSENQAIIRFINERLEAYRPTIRQHTKQLEESIQKIKDGIHAACIKGDKNYIEKYVNNPNVPEEVRKEAKRCLDIVTRNPGTVFK